MNQKSLIRLRVTELYQNRRDAEAQRRRTIPAMNLKISMLLAWLVLPFAVFPQQDDDREKYYEDLVQFTGVVVTGDSLKPVPYTHIIDRTRNRGTISDYYGYFSFVAQRGDTIEG